MTTFTSQANPKQLNAIITFDNIVHHIQQKDFRIPERPTKLCQECDMHPYCDTKNWQFRSRAKET